MFAKTIIDSDAFLDMPLSAQALYFHLSMRADDDGFINNPRRIQRMIGGTDDDLKLLIAKSFVIEFDSGVIVIKHWRINNYIQKDRYKETVYTDEREMLSVKENGSYTLCIQDGYSSDTQVRLGKNSLGKNSISKFTPPTLEEVSDYCQERNNGVDPQKFIDFYESKGWMVGKNRMKDWKASVRTWERDDNKKKKPQYKQFAHRDDGLTDLERELISN